MITNALDNVYANHLSVGFLIDQFFEKTDKVKLMHLTYSIYIWTFLITDIIRLRVYEHVDKLKKENFTNQLKWHRS